MKWISVKEGLPQEGITVFVYSKEYSNDDPVLAYFEDGEWIDIDFEESPDFAIIKDPVTHWMPLPEPPKD